MEDVIRNSYLNDFANRFDCAGEKESVQFDWGRAYRICRNIASCEQIPRAAGNNSAVSLACASNRYSVAFTMRAEQEVVFETPDHAGLNAPDVSVLGVHQHHQFLGNDHRWNLQYGRCLRT